LQIWRQYFGPAATIYGIDIDPRCAAVNDPPSTNIMIGSPADPNFLRSAIARMGG
jgi:hypothetical protein